MSSAVVYIDHSHAKIFWLEVNGVQTEELKEKDHLHHSSRDSEKLKDSTPLFHKVAEKLKTATEILVVGHGVAKDQFVHHLEEHKHTDVRKKVVGIKACDHPTDKQVLAVAREFFKHEHLFS